LQNDVDTCTVNENGRGMAITEGLRDTINQNFVNCCANKV